MNLSAYNPAGEQYPATAPMGAQTRRTWDAAGRLTEEIQGRVPGQDRITGYTYNPDGNLTLLTALNDGSEEQRTQWVYGVTIQSPGGAVLTVAYTSGVLDTVSGTGFSYKFTWGSGRIRTVTQKIGTTEVRRTVFAYWGGAVVNFKSVTNEESRDNGTKPSPKKPKYACNCGDRGGVVA